MIEHFNLAGPCFIAPSAYWRFRAVERLADLSADRLAARKASEFAVRDGVAIVRVRGVMVKDPFWMDEISTIDITNNVRAAAADQSVTAIMLVIDSPGGSAGGIADLADAIYSARQSKPVVAFVDGMAASAAYWAASQASKIHLGRDGMVGSIGVYSVIRDWSEYHEKEGIKTHVIRTGAFKGTGVEGAPISEDELAEGQRVVNGFFEVFLADITRGRPLMSRERLLEVADGRVFIGQDAVTRGLADQAASFGTVFNSLRSDSPRSGGPGPGFGAVMYGPNAAAADLLIASAELSDLARSPGADLDEGPEPTLEAQDD